MPDIQPAIHVLFILYTGLIGLVIGSFLNVVIWRLPRRQSLASPPSACPVCHHRLHARDLVPVVSWLLLRRRCRYCHTPISGRYPLIESATGLIYVVAVTGYGFVPLTVVWLLLLPAALAAAMIMLDKFRERNRKEKPRPIFMFGAVLAAAFIIAVLSVPWLS